MPSRKKDRGKQRKAKKKCDEEAARAGCGDWGQEQGPRERAATGVHYTAELREIVSKLSGSRSGVLRDQFLEKGIHTQLLFFFSQCDKSIYDVVPVRCDADEGMPVPSLWLDILRLIVRHDGCPDDVLFEVAKSLGPVVEGITNSKRELFQSRMVWHMCISHFFELVHNVMQSRRGFVQMLSYEGLLPFVAQASCWRVSRTDIVAEARLLQPPDDFHENVCHGAQSIIRAVIDRQNEFEGEPVVCNALERIARAPLLSNDPNCLDSSIVGMLRLLGYNDGRFVGKIIESLLFAEGYVDARVIAGMIEIGREDCANLPFILATMNPILGLDEDYGHVQPIDSRYAAAVRSGLLEVLIGALVYEENRSYAKAVYSIAKGIYAMAGHNKTSRALRRRKAEILDALGTLRENHQSDLSNDICSVVEDAVDYGTPICCNCLKSFGRTVLRFCQSCMVECYCSAACQAESWDAGHSETCDGMGVHSRNEREATELKRYYALRQNVMVNGCRFVQRNIDKIQLALKGEKCNAVKVDFAEYPPMFRLPLRKTGNQYHVGGLYCIFSFPVRYGFVAENGVAETFGLKKVIPHSVVAEIESKDPQTTFEARVEGREMALDEQK